MGEFAEKIFKYYNETKLWNKKRVDKALELKSITQDEYEQIISGIKKEG